MPSGSSSLLFGSETQAKFQIPVEHALAGAVAARETLLTSNCVAARFGNMSPMPGLSRAPAGGGQRSQDRELGNFFPIFAFIASFWLVAELSF